MGQRTDRSRQRYLLPLDPSTTISGAARLTERFFIGIFDGSEVAREEFRVLRDVVLSNHVFHRGLDRSWLHRVDGTEGQTEKAI